MASEDSVDVERLLAQDVMSSPGIACREEAFIEEIAEILASRELSGLPVVDAQDEVVGIVSERDLAHVFGGPLIRLALRRPVRSTSDLKQRGADTAARRAKEIMSSPAIVAGARTPVQVLADVMAVEAVNRIPIVEGERLAGIVTRGDILSALAGLPRRTVDLNTPAVIVGSDMTDARRGHQGK